MTAFVDSLDTVRAAVASAGSAADADLRQALTRAGLDDVEAIGRPDGALSHVRLRPPGPLRLADLEARYGPVRRLPTRPDAQGEPRVVQFTDTIPAEGAVGATVLAEVDEDDRVVRVTLRRDEF